MNIKDKFRIAVIEAIHNKPYKEAVKIESTDIYYTKPITIGRVLSAFYKKNKMLMIDEFGNIYILSKELLKKRDCLVGIGLNGNDIISQCTEIHWKLTDENGKELTHEEQSEETLEKILNLLTK